MTTNTYNLGYSLINLANNFEVYVWGDTPGITFTLPQNIVLPDGTPVNNPTERMSVKDSTNNTYTFLPRVGVADLELNAQITGETINANSSQVTVTYQYRNPTQTELLAYAANSRWNIIENGIFNTNGVITTTDQGSQASLTSICTLMTLFPNTVIDFKVANGSFITANASVMIGISYMVAGFVQTCFGTEAAIDTAILANSITTFDQIDSSFADLVAAGSA